MKEFARRNHMFYYVVYCNGERDDNYENDKREILRKWDSLTIDDLDEIVIKCSENPKPFKGIPCGEEKEVYAIAIDGHRCMEAAFFHIVPKNQQDNIA